MILLDAVSLMTMILRSGTATNTSVSSSSSVHARNNQHVSCIRLESLWGMGMRLLSGNSRLSLYRCQVDAMVRHCYLRRRYRKLRNGARETSVDLTNTFRVPPEIELSVSPDLQYTNAEGLPVSYGYHPE